MERQHNKSILTQHPNCVQQEYAGQRSIVLVPSIGLGGLCRQYITGLQFYEERYLYYITYLKNPKTQLVAVLSEGVEPAVIEYFLTHAAKAIGCSVADLQKRFTLLTIPTRKNSTLTQNILRSKTAQKTIQKCLLYPTQAYIEFWNVTTDEVQLAAKIGIPYYGLHSSAIFINSKAGARKTFLKSGLQIARGAEVRTLHAAYSALRKLSVASNARAFLMKLNDEGAGVGIIKVQRDDFTGTFQEFRKNIVMLSDQELQQFEEFVRKEGCVVEEFIEAKYVESPSVQFEVDPAGKIHPIASHDQMLHGTEYFGTRFPANAEYRKQIIRAGKKVTRKIAQIGGRNFIAMDFLVTRNRKSQPWKVYGIEVNARKGGANHTNMWAKYLTNAHYNAQRGILESAHGDVYYKASEKFLSEPWLAHISPKTLLSAIQHAGLDFSSVKQSGVFVHLLSPLRHFGKFGVTVIGHSKKEVEQIWEALQKTVNQLKS